MYHIVIKDKGAGYQLLRQELKSQPLKQGDVLIAVQAAGVNRADILLSLGRYPSDANAPGLEVSGVVLESASANFNKGDEVMALLSDGGYATHCVMSDESVFHKPKTLSFEKAASMVEALFTVFYALEKGNFQKGDAVLITSATGGIGIVGIQLINALGGVVWASSRLREKAKKLHKTLPFLKGVFVHGEENFEQELSKQSFDVIIDILAGDKTALFLKALKTSGSLVQIGFVEGARSALSWPDIMARSLNVTGFMLQKLDAKIKACLAQKITDFLKTNDALMLDPIIAAEFPLADAKEAHKLMLSGTHLGKIILKV